MFEIYIDGDACPVKQETFRVAKRYDLEVFVVVNRPIQLPTADKVHLVVVPGGFDAADDWIAGHAGFGDIVITADIPLAAPLPQSRRPRAGAQGARVHRGRDRRGAGHTNRHGPAPSTWRTYLWAVRHGWPKPLPVPLQAG